MISENKNNLMKYSQRKEFIHLITHSYIVNIVYLTINT